MLFVLFKLTNAWGHSQVKKAGIRLKINVDERNLCTQKSIFQESRIKNQESMLAEIDRLSYRLKLTANINRMITSHLRLGQ